MHSIRQQQHHQARCGKKVEVKYKFTSEAPGAQGLPQKQMLLLNNRPEVIYDDMLALNSGFVCFALVNVAS